MIDRVLRSPRGIIGYIPLESIDAAKRVALIEVVLELDDRTRESIPMAVPLADLQTIVWKSQGNALNEVCASLGERARARWEVMNPDRAHEIARADEIYWIHRSQRRRFPFLRS